MRLRLLSLIIPLLFLPACGSDAEPESSDADSTRDKRKTVYAQPKIESIPAQKKKKPAIPTAKTSLGTEHPASDIPEYHGWIGEQPIIFRFDPSSDPPSGNYFFVESSESRQLKGVYDPDKNVYVLSEKVEGESTGYIRFQVQDTTLIGHQSRTLDMADSVEFRAFRIPPLSYSDATVRSRYEGRHSEMRKTGVLEPDGKGDVEQRIFEEENYLDLEYVGGRHFKFKMLTIGENAHRAGTRGYAVLIAEDQLIWRDGKINRGSMFHECILGIQFNRNEVEVVTHAPCRAYAGTRAEMDVVLPRK